jgi:hypothetical protein
VSDIKVGDLVMVVRGARCCGGSDALGLIFKVDSIFHYDATDSKCRHCHAPAESGPVADSHLPHVWYLHKLRRIPPLDELERDQIVKELTA